MAGHSGLIVACKPCAAAASPAVHCTKRGVGCALHRSKGRVAVVIIALGSELSEIAVFEPPKALTVVPDLWKQWVAHARLEGYTRRRIADVLIANGYSQQAALGQAQAAASDPYLAGSLRHHQHMKKAVALFDAQSRVRRLDSRANLVERRGSLSLEEFRDHYYARNRPLIIEGLVGEWKAFTTWTPDYLKRTTGQSIVEVMTGRSSDAADEIKAHLHCTNMRFDAYVDLVYSGKATNDGHHRQQRLLPEAGN